MTRKAWESVKMGLDLAGGNRIAPRGSEARELVKVPPGNLRSRESDGQDSRLAPDTA